MAEALKRRFDLLTLRIAMNLTGDSPMVSFTLQGKYDGESDCFFERMAEAAEIGLPERLSRSETVYEGMQFALPVAVVRDLEQVIADSDYEDQPLWLHLAKPLGYLNLVPWEELLQRSVRRPILRLPDFLANPPRENVRRLEVAICCSMPIAKGHFTAVDHLFGMANDLLDTVPRKTTVHIFSDAALFPDISRRVDESHMDRIMVHDPADAEWFASSDRQYSLEGRSGRVRNPWLLWMLDALADRSVDMVHFLTHGYVSEEAGALAFAESPIENQDRRMARFVGVAELIAFLTQSGAWCTAFTSPEGNYSEMGLRQLADTVAQLRPGPVLHHETRLDESGEALRNAYRFLFGRADEPAPESSAVFMYCHPELFESPKPAIWQSQTRSGDRGVPSLEDTVREFYQESEVVPSWVGSSQRYFEQRRREVMELKAHEATMSDDGTPSLIDDAEVIEKTLEQIERALGNVLTNKGFGGD
ncbi:MAG: hypothetical protein R3D30_12350 [Hyphomicrobiales bacterium]